MKPQSASVTLRGTGCWRRLFMLIYVSLVTVVHAHDPGLSSVAVTLEPGRCEAELIFSKVDAAIVLRSLTGSEESWSASQIAAGLEKFGAAALELAADGRESRPDVVHTRADDSGNVIMDLGYAGGAGARISVRSRWIALMPPGHREFASIQRANGEALSSRLLSANADSTSLDLGEPPRAAEPASKSTFLSFLAMGVMHIWTGYDHLLFLFGLLAVTRRVGTVFKIITCFTVAHSLTLALATLNVIEIPSRIVEPMIAASIVFVGVENFVRNGEPKGRWLLTFLFGLVHGFGFASALRESGVGEHSGGIAVPLVSFNLGVELGQMAVAVAALPLIWKLRDQPQLVRRWIPVTSGVVGILGTYWFVQRIF